MRTRVSSVVSRFSGRTAVLWAAIIGICLAAHPTGQGSASSYAVYTSEGRRPLPFRTVSGVDMVSLDQLASLFNLTLTEDTLAGGLTVRSRTQAILLIPGQSFASIGPGRIVSLPGSVQRDRGSWQVPVEFVKQALGPAIGQKVELRRSSHVILVGDVRLPQVAGRFERQGAGARLTLEIQPATPHRITREGTRLVVRIDAVALDFSPVTNLVSEFATAVRVEGPSLVVDLGPSSVGFHADDQDATHVVIDLTAPSAPPTPVAATRPQQAPEPPPVVDLTPAGAIRTVVIDPGHGGMDEGAHGPAGTKEKDLVLQMARRLKSSIESKIGIRVLLTRETDDDVPMDRRTALANNNKADLLISLHANASVLPATQGVQVLSLRLEDYQGRASSATATDALVPVAGGGTRLVELVPWDLAQLPFASQSVTMADVLVKHLMEREVPMYTVPIARLPLRALVGANMPAVMLEMGFLTNEADEKALTDGDRAAKILEAVVAAIGDARRGLLMAANADGRAGR